MANFSVTGSHYLRSFYSANRELSSGSERLKVNTKDLAKADAKALKKGISALSGFDYDQETEDSVALYKTMKAFADTYNQTLESGGKLSDDPSTKKVVKEIQKLREEYGDELADYGITFDSKGYMSLSESAFDNISVSQFKDMFGEDSEFLADLSKLQKKLSRRIDYLV